MLTVDEKATSPQDEKHPELVTTESVNSNDADEALELVGLQRESHFSEEYNLKLRRKLVSSLIYSAVQQTINVNIGLDYPSPLRCCIFYTILVSHPLRHIGQISVRILDSQCNYYRDKNSLNYMR